MLRKLLFTVPKSFFWKKTPTKNIVQQMKEATEQAKNLSFLIQQMRTLNQNKSRLLKPKDNDKLTVVMELDQFLIYTFAPDEEGYLLAPYRKFDYYYELNEWNACLSIYKRKNLDNFLNYLHEQCEPVIFSTGAPQYVNLIMSLIDPQRRIKHIFHQQHCNRIINDEEQIDQYLKDLDLLDRSYERLLYIDSRPMSFWPHPDNSLPKLQFRADQTMTDQDLNLTILQLQNLRKMKDVRPFLKEKYNLSNLLKQSKLL